VLVGMCITGGYICCIVPTVFVVCVVEFQCAL